MTGLYDAVGNIEGEYDPTSEDNQIRIKILTPTRYEFEIDFYVIIFLTNCVYHPSWVESLLVRMPQLGQVEPL